jgi:UDP-N-acetylglucosamine--N-acetylmuramyl-(pentapeptide) pyrophosphoryl-undecaprenol N-acetylglucosamine transferase
MSNKAQKIIIFTGGGSGGHVMPSLTLIKDLKRRQNHIYYIGSKSGIERSLVGDIDIPYFPITTGKLRRYISFQNFTDLFRICWGIIQAFFCLLRFKRKESIIFSTGGFVTVPVVVAAWLQGKKIFVHEQTSRVGLANKIASRFATKVFVSFEASLNYFPKGKTVFSGYPLRDECLSLESQSVILEDWKVEKDDTPYLFITGGGNGSLLLNQAVKNNLDILKKNFKVIHQVGQNFLDEYQELNDNRYKALAFINHGMIDLFKISSVVLSRAGAGTVCELLSLGRPSIFIPLKIAQKNEQFHNAKEAEKRNGSIVIEEDELSSERLLKAIDDIHSREWTPKESSKNGKDFLISEIENS